jgi:signal transduction histidine kinase
VFKNLRTSTKLVILCGIFLISIGVTTISLVAEQQIAIAFARKELIGTRYLADVRRIYAAVLSEQPFGNSAAPPAKLADAIRNTLAAAQLRAGASLQTGELAQALAEALRLWSRNPASDYALDVLAKASQLVSRIADDSNLALDPDLDTYHLQDLITRKLPVFLRQLAEMQVLAQEAAASASPTREQQARLDILEGLLQSTASEINSSLAAAYRGNAGGTLQPAVEGAFAAMMAGMNAYLGGLKAGAGDRTMTLGSAPSTDRLYGGAIGSAIDAWTSAQSELDALIRKRIDGLLQRMWLSLALIGALVMLSIVIAVMTHRHIVGPLERLEKLASTVRETKDYTARLDYSSKNEIGQLARAFNDMLAELAAARDRERSEQAELTRVARLTTLGTMAASIAHEINQPLAAIVAHGNAAQRWLSSAHPDLDEARASLKSIINDGHRASQVIGSVRAMFQKGQREKAECPLNDVIEDAFRLVHSELRKQEVSVRTELLAELPHVVADRVQLLQVFMNLTRNALEAMEAVRDRTKLLIVRSGIHEPGAVAVTFEDTGTGIDPGDTERIFDALFTTKSSGTGLGLTICRSIVEAHGGRLWASPRVPHGTAFHVVLPSAAT